MMIAALLLQAAAPAACPTLDAALPPTLAAWSRPVTRLAPGAATVLVAQPSRGADPKRPGRVAGVTFAVPKAGTYRIALDQPGWIDVAPMGGAPLASVAHGHGPACSTIRKLVGFRLEPGSYRLSLTGLARERAKVMLVAGE